MMFTAQQQEQFELFDEFIRYYNLDELKTAVEASKVAEKLRSPDAAPMPSFIDTMTSHISMLEANNNVLDSRIIDLENTVRELLRFMSETQNFHHAKSNEVLQPLFSRSGIWY